MSYGGLGDGWKDFVYRCCSNCIYREYDFYKGGSICKLSNLYVDATDRCGRFSDRINQSRKDSCFSPQEKMMTQEEKDALCQALQFARLTDEEVKQFKEMLKDGERSE